MVENLGAQNHYNLDRVAQVLPKIFASEKSRQAFFSRARSEDAPYLGIQGVYGRELQRLAAALTSHAGRAAKRGEVACSRRAFELAVDVCLLPMQLLPPRQIILADGTKIPGASSLNYIRILSPTDIGVTYIRQELQGIKSPSPARAKRIQPESLASSQADRHPD